MKKSTKYILIVAGVLGVFAWLRKSGSKPLSGVWDDLVSAFSGGSGSSESALTELRQATQGLILLSYSSPATSSYNQAVQDGKIQALLTFMRVHKDVVDRFSRAIHAVSYGTSFDFISFFNQNFSTGDFVYSEYGELPAAVGFMALGG